MKRAEAGKRDSRVELLRIAGCFMVILTHIRLEPVVNGTVLKTPVFIGAFLTPAVGLFFLATGFFIYEGEKPFGKVVKHFLIKVLIPTLAVAFLTMLTERWLLGETSLAECLKGADLHEILNRIKDGILHISSDYWGVLCAHLWYIAEYAKLILFYPAMIIIARYAGLRILVYLAGMNLVYYCQYDLYIGTGMSDFFMLEPLLRSSQALVLAGCIMFRSKEKMKAKKYMPILFLAAYTGAVMCIYFFQMKQFSSDAGGWGGAYYTTWLSGTGMLSAICLTGFLLTLPDKLKLLKWIEKPVLFLGSLSFPVYLIQYAVIVKMSVLGYDQPFKSLASGSIGTVLYYVIYGTVISVICILISLVLRAAARSIVCGTGKLKKAAALSE